MITHCKYDKVNNDKKLCELTLLLLCVRGRGDGYNTLLEYKFMLSETTDRRVKKKTKEKTMLM